MSMDIPDINIPDKIDEIRTATNQRIDTIIQTGKETQDEIDAKIEKINQQITQLTNEINDKSHIGPAKEFKIGQIKHQIKKLNKQIKTLIQGKREITVLQTKLSKANQEDISRINRFSNEFLFITKLYAQTEGLQKKIGLIENEVEGVEVQMRTLERSLKVRTDKLFEPQQKKITRIARWSFSTNRLKTFEKIDANIRPMELINNIVDKPKDEYEFAEKKKDQLSRKIQGVPGVCQERFNKDIQTQWQIITDFKDKYPFFSNQNLSQPKTSSITLKDATSFRAAVKALDKLDEELKSIKTEYENATKLLESAKKFYTSSPVKVNKINNFKTALDNATTEAEFKKIKRDIEAAFSDSQSIVWVNNI